jgi:hypothetical protein
MDAGEILEKVTSSQQPIDQNILRPSAFSDFRHLDVKKRCGGARIKLITGSSVANANKPVTSLALNAIIPFMR